MNKLLLFLFLCLACSCTQHKTQPAGEKATGSALFSLQLAAPELTGTGANPATYNKPVTVQLSTGAETRSALLDLNRGSDDALFPGLPVGSWELKTVFPWENTLIEYRGAARFLILEDTTTPLFIRLAPGNDCITAELHTQGRLILWCTLDGETAITRPAFGPAGTITGGGFKAGKFGNCYTASHTEDLMVSFPGAVIPANRGCIEFWAKLEGYDATQEIPVANWPTFFQCQYNECQYRCGIYANNGLGGGGLSFQADAGSAATGDYTDWLTLESILGEGRAADWHHYAVCWDIEGIPGYDKNTRIMLFLDGVRHGSSYLVNDDKNPTQLRTPDAARLFLIDNHDDYGQVKFQAERVCMDNLKIWNYARTIFTDREREGI